MAKITIVIVILCMFGTVFSSGEIRDVPDFQHKPEILQLSHFAVDEFNKQQHGDLSFSKVVKAQKQVVAGLMYYLTIEAVDGGQKGLYAAKVLVQSWRNITELQEFKPLQSAKKDKRLASEWHNLTTEDPMVQEAALNAVKIMQQRSNSLVPYELQKILSAKEKEFNGLNNFKLLLKIKWGNKVLQYEVEMKRNLDGKWTLKNIQQNANN